MKIKLKEGPPLSLEIVDESLTINYLKYRDLLLALRSQMSPMLYKTVGGFYRFTLQYSLEDSVMFYSYLSYTASYNCSTLDSLCLKSLLMFNNDT